jgi:hypothetical protein
MRQTNVIEFPLQQRPESDRLRLYLDEAGTIVVLSTARAEFKLRHARRSAK